LTEVPFFPQEAYQCGPAALAMALQTTGIAVTPDDLVPMVYIPDRKGSLQSGMIGGTRRHGRLAYPIEGFACLVRELTDGHPVIVLQNLGLSWIPRWHYAVVVGYDLDHQQVILHTGVTSRRRVRWSTFMRTWERASQWGLVVLEAGALPACAEEHAYLKAVLGLQQAHQYPQAQDGFQAAAAQWPQSVNARMGLGNILYLNGDLAGAEDAFRTASELDPSNGDAFNNLAHVLAESGRLEAAMQAIRKAIDLGGSNQPTYKQTFEDIKARLVTEQP
jgi:hypothetical protein